MIKIELDVVEVNLRTYKERKVAHRDYTCNNLDEAEKIWKQQEQDKLVFNMLNEDSAVEYRQLPEQDASYKDAFAFYWIPAESYDNTRIYKEIHTFHEYEEE